MKIRPEDAPSYACTQSPWDPDIHCQGPMCMAWRWVPLMMSESVIAAIRKRGLETGDRAPFAKSARYVLENCEEFGLPSKPFEGYCGLGGQP